MKTIKYIFSALLLAAAMTTMLSSCSEEKLGPSIFEDGEEVLDPNSASYKFDKWLKINYLDKYNLEFRYRMQDVGTNMNYNLVPATYENAIDLAVLTKYLWFDVYDKVVSTDFLKLYGPRIIHLIGSPAYNPTSGTMILGLAEGGIKVSLFRVNDMNINDFNQMNEYYFKTMHHEFAHILHQTKSYPVEFNRLSVGHYDGSNWQSRNPGQVASLGFVTTYASSEYREDFAETIANFIVKTDQQYEDILSLGDCGWDTDGDPDDPDADYYRYYYYRNNEAGPENKVGITDERNVFTEEVDGVVSYYYRNDVDADGNRIIVYQVEDKDGIDGRAVILQKVEIARQWLKDAWNVDLDELRKEVQKRQLNFKIEELRQQVYDQE